MSIRGRLDVAESSALNVKDNELTKEGVVVNDEHAGALKTPHMDVSIWPSVSRLAIGKWLAAGRAGRRHRTSLLLPVESGL
jgi:hypothetical protein